MGSKQLQVKTWHLRKMDWEQTNGKQNTKHLRKISFLLGAPFFPVIGSHKEGFFHASTCHLLRVPITGVFFQTYALPHAPSTRCFRAGPFFKLLRSLRLPRRVGFPSTSVHPRLGVARCACHIPIRDVSFGTFALPRAPASVSTPWFSWHSKWPRRASKIKLK